MDVGTESMHTHSLLPLFVPIIEFLFLVASCLPFQLVSISSNVASAIHKESIQGSELSPLHYIPSRVVSIIMITLFGLSSGLSHAVSSFLIYLKTNPLLVIHTGQALYHKTLWLIPTAVLCGLLETVGWVGRLWLRSSPAEHIALQVQDALLLPHSRVDRFVYTDTSDMGV